jgi:hypothetical protein
LCWWLQLSVRSVIEHFLGDGHARNPPAGADLNSAAVLGVRDEVRLRPVSVALGVDEHQIPSHKYPDAPERPITFRAAEDVNPFELAELWANRTAWPVSERTAYDELAELACMSALAKWLTRWQPIAIYSAVLAGARMEAIAAALGNSLQVAFDRWHEWASKQRDFVNNKPAIAEDEYEAVTLRFFAVGIKPPIT